MITALPVLALLLQPGKISGPLSHHWSDRVRLFSDRPDWTLHPPLWRFRGQQTCISLHPPNSNLIKKKKQKGIYSPPSGRNGSEGQSGVNWQQVHLHPTTHRAERAVSVNSQSGHGLVILPLCSVRDQHPDPPLSKSRVCPMWKGP